MRDLLTLIVERQSEFLFFLINLPFLSFNLILFSKDGRAEKFENRQCVLQQTFVPVYVKNEGIFGLIKN